MSEPVQGASAPATSASAPARGAGNRSELFRQLPNILTLARIAAIPLIVYLLRDPGWRAAWVTMGVYLAASLTDFLDGYVARRYGLVTALGKLLDPLADKLLVVSALVMLAVMERTPGIPGWLLVVIIGRELAVTGLRSIAASEGIVVGAEATGKIKMFLQTVGVTFLIVHYVYLGVSFHDVGMVLLLASVVFGVWSAVGYHVQVFRQLHARGGNRAEG